MNEGYGRDLDLNLLRVFVAVVDAGSVTAAASRLYLTQPAVSAAIRRLKATVGEALFVRRGRGLGLTARGERLAAEARPALRTLVDATLSPARFDPSTSDRILRLGLSDASEGWLLPPLLRALEKIAPRMRVIVLPVQFRTVTAALATQRLDAVVTVADELPSDIRRKRLFTGGHVCFYDPRRVRFASKVTVTEREYFAEEHVIVSYNGDLRGVIEDFVGKTRRVRCSIPTFDSVGAIIEGTRLLATIPAIVAEHLRSTRPALATAGLPFGLLGTGSELLWPASSDGDDAARLLRATLERVAVEVTGRAPRGPKKRKKA